MSTLRKVEITMFNGCPIYTDDGGTSWQLSELFPEGTAEEAALVE
jgi:hypothetical protein